MRTRLIILVLLAALAIAAYITHGFGLLAPQVGGPLALYGNVDIRSVDLGFRVPGRIAAMPVEEGAHVEAGTVLAQLDPKPLTDALNAAQAQVDVAGAERDKRRAGNRPQDIAQAEASVAERRASLVQTRQDFERRSQLGFAELCQHRRRPALAAPAIVDRHECLGRQQCLELLFVGREFQVGGQLVGGEGGVSARDLESPPIEVRSFGRALE